MGGVTVVFRGSLGFRVASLSETALVFILCLSGLCSSEGVEETNRMSVGGQMRGGKSDEEVCACVCINPRKDFL